MFTVQMCRLYPVCVFLLPYPTHCDKKQFSNVRFIPQNQAEANPKLHPYGADLSRYLTLLFISLVQIFMAFIITVLVVYSPVFISLLPFPCFFSKRSHARNPSFLAKRASNHSSFNMFWLSFCVFSHVGSSCLFLHPGISWQQGMLFHIGKIPCEYINWYTWFLRIT